MVWRPGLALPTTVATPTTKSRIEATQNVAQERSADGVPQRQSKHERFQPRPTHTRVSSAAGAM